MITHSDESYRATKRIKQGKDRLTAPFDELAQWIAKRWRVVVLNVIYDARNEDLHAPRLRVILERTQDMQVFLVGANYDSSKQGLIAAKLIELCKNDHLRHWDVSGLFVAFSAFAPLALEEADGKLTDLQIEELQRRLNNPDLWCISRCFGEVTFMLYTDKQVAKYEADGTKEAFATEYLAAIKPFDEFGYSDMNRFVIRLDSKENFDRTFHGNWFNYYR